ncbi:MAG: hypothetical protein ACREV4_14925 [Gammaproteobacteria bacterium]
MKSPRLEGAIQDPIDDGESNHHSTGPASPPQDYTVTCTAFRAFEKNTLEGFADLLINPPQLLILNCTVHRKGDRRWINFPAVRSVTEGDEITWRHTMKLPYGEVHWEFQNKAFEAIGAFLGVPHGE